METSDLKIIAAKTPDHFQQGRTLFLAYADSLNFDLCFQNFEEELEQLEQIYGPPNGVLLLVANADRALGCVAVRELSEGNCEMKRMYIDPAGRGLGLGRKLADAAIAFAREKGYKRILLDTLETMTAALYLYKALGFTEIPPYYHNPHENTVYLALSLDAPQD